MDFEEQILEATKQKYDSTKNEWGFRKQEWGFHWRQTLWFHQHKIVNDGEF